MPIITRSHLLSTEQAGSVLRHHHDNAGVAYDPFGYNHAATDEACLGFNGQLNETATQTYLLGNGHRAFNPVLRRFHSPDTLSPFGRGGINAYMYCLGDPVNRSDPSGRIPKFLKRLWRFAWEADEIPTVTRSPTLGKKFDPSGLAWTDNAAYRAPPLGLIEDIKNLEVSLDIHRLWKQYGVPGRLAPNLTKSQIRAEQRKHMKEVVIALADKKQEIYFFGRADNPGVDLSTLGANPQIQTRYSPRENQRNHPLNRGRSSLPAEQSYRVRAT